MIYLLTSSTGEYEDWRETIHGYFSNRELAENKLKEIKDFDELIFKRFKNKSGKYYYDVYDFQRKCYHKFGIRAYIDYSTGISWGIKEIKEFNQWNNN